MDYKQRKRTLQYSDTKDKKKSVRKERKHIIIEYIYIIIKEKEERKRKQSTDVCCYIYVSRMIVSRAVILHHYDYNYK